MSPEHQQLVVLLALWLIFVLPFASECSEASVLDASANSAFGRNQSLGADSELARQANTCDYDAALAIATSLNGNAAEGGEDYADDLGAILCWVSLGQGADETLEVLLGATASFANYAVPSLLLLASEAHSEPLRASSQPCLGHPRFAPEVPPPRLA